MELAWSSPSAGRRPTPLLSPDLLSAPSTRSRGAPDAADDSPDSPDSGAGPSGRTAGAESTFSPPAAIPSLRTATAAAAVRACLRADYLEGAFRIVRASRLAIRSPEPYDALVIGCAKRGSRPLAERAVREVRRTPPVLPTFELRPSRLIHSAGFLRLVWKRSLLFGLGSSSGHSLSALHFRIQAVNDLWAPGPKAARMLLRVMSTPGPLMFQPDIEVWQLSVDSALIRSLCRKRDGFFVALALPGFT